MRTRNEVAGRECERSCATVWPPGGSSRSLKRRDMDLNKHFGFQLHCGCGMLGIKQYSWKEQHKAIFFIVKGVQVCPAPHPIMLFNSPEV